MEIAALYKEFLASSGVTTDTRQITPNSLFFALKGEKFDGNQFAKDALAKGAAYAIVDDATVAIDEQYILVADSLKTLQALANYHRKQLKNLQVIAVGGSNGKTTTKELIAAVLSKKFKTFATPGNFNNHIGLPLTLLRITAAIEMAVIEMGANHEGEIAELCAIAEPNFGIITNIGLDHLEGFGSLEGVARANSELYFYLLKNKGIAFVNTQEEHLTRMAARLENVITYPQKNNFYHAELLPTDLFLKVKTEKDEIFDAKLIGHYNFANMATALCIGKYFEVPSALANEAVANYQPSNNRSQLIQKGSNTIILDAYNANPSSMQQALANFAQIKANKKVVILGDMYELGDYSEAEHEKLGQLLAQYAFDMVIFTGKEIAAALKYMPKAYFIPDKFSLHNWLADKQIQDAHFLIKGSRGMSLETVVNFL